MKTTDVGSEGPTRFFVGVDLSVEVASEDEKSAFEKARNSVIAHDEAALIAVRILPVSPLNPSPGVYRVLLQAVMEISAADQAAADVFAERAATTSKSALSAQKLAHFAYPVLPPEDLTNIGERIRKLPGVIRFLTASAKSNGATPTEADQRLAQMYMREVGGSAEMRTIMRALATAEHFDARPALKHYVRINQIMDEISHRPGVLAIFSQGL